MIPWLILSHLRQDLGDFAGFCLIGHQELAEILEVLHCQEM